MDEDKLLAERLEANRNHLRAVADPERRQQLDLAILDKACAASTLRAGLAKELRPVRAPFSARNNDC